MKKNSTKYFFDIRNYVKSKLLKLGVNDIDQIKMDTFQKKKISSSATEGQKKWGKRTMEGVFQLFLCYRINLIENLKK